MNEKPKDLFTLEPKVSFRSSRKLGAYLVRANMYPLKRPVGSAKCNSTLSNLCKC